jgi:hypothetical protein
MTSLSFRRSASNRNCGHPTEVANGDKWLKAHIDAYAQWAREHNSLLIITWDEDSSTYHYPTARSQSILNAAAGESHCNDICRVDGGGWKRRAKRYISFYDLLRTIEICTDCRPWAAVRLPGTSPIFGSEELPAPDVSRTGMTSTSHDRCRGRVPPVPCRRAFVTNPFHRRAAPETMMPLFDTGGRR